MKNGKLKQLQDKWKQLKDKVMQVEYEVEDKLWELKEKLRKFFRIKELKPLCEMTDEEIRMQVLRNLHRTKEPAPYRYDGLDYSRHYLRTHTPEEIEARWNGDIETLMKIIDAYDEALKE